MEDREIEGGEIEWGRKRRVEEGGSERAGEREGRVGVREQRQSGRERREAECGNERAEKEWV